MYFRQVTRTSSITNTLERFRIARAMQSSCFSLLGKCQRTIGVACWSPYPVEKFSPPSETGESKFRNTLALTVSAASSGVSSDGIKCTRRSASYCEKGHKDVRRHEYERRPYNFSISVFAEDIKGGSQCPTQDSWILWIQDYNRKDL